jgi:hypothetical protein
MPKPQTKQYPDGVVLKRRSQYTGTVVLVVHARQYATSRARSPKAQKAVWATVCQIHDYLVAASSLAEARDKMSRPDGWCADCAKPIGKA